MALTYAQLDANGTRVQYRDRKRWWWALSVIHPLLPFAGIAAHAATGREIALGVPLLVSYGLLPLLDFLLGEDENNPPEAVVPQLDDDRYYRWLTWITVPLHFERGFTRGLVDTRQLVLYVTVTLFCLFLTVRSLESRRWR